MPTKHGRDASAEFEKTWPSGGCWRSSQELYCGAMVGRVQGTLWWACGVSSPASVPKTNRMKLPSKIQLFNSPFLYDLLCVLSHMVVTDDMIQAGQGLLHILLQALQVLRLFVDRDDGVLQLHQTTFKGGEDRNLHTKREIDVRTSFHMDPCSRGAVRAGQSGTFRSQLLILDSATNLPWLLRWAV